MELERLAVAACKGGGDEELADLLAALKETKNLSKLDDEGNDSTFNDGFRLAEGARLGRILRTLTRLQPEKAPAIILRIAGDKKFMSSHRRVAALMESCGEFHTPSKEILDFLEAQATPDSSAANIIDGIMIEMGSRNALERLERRLFTAGLNRH